MRSSVLRRRVLVGAAIVVAAGFGVLAVVRGLGGAPASGAGIDNGSPTGLMAVTRRSLSQQTQVSATLGYAHTSTIVEPAGTAPSAVQEAESTASTDRGMLDAARSTLAADAQVLARDRAMLAAAQAKEEVDCGGANAAQAPAVGGSGGSDASASPCAGDQQSASTAQQAATMDAAKVAADRGQVSAANRGLAAAELALASAEASAGAYDQTSTYTSLPAVGEIVRRGGTLFAISGRPVVLLYGPSAAWRPFRSGISAGPDVAALNANLRALGDGPDLRGDTFTRATEAALKAFQAEHGLEPTGRLPLGSIVFEPGAVRVTSVTPTAGSSVQPGPVLGVTSTRRQVTIELDAAQQSHVKVGDPVTITLPDNSTTPGRVSFVGTVASTPSSSGDQGGGGSDTPTIEVDVTPLDPAATGRLDQAPVNVSITTASVPDVLVVPVNALLALASGGYALEEVGAGRVHRLLGVQVGLFDDASGLVEVTGRGLAAGQRVVVPSG